MPKVLERAAFWLTCGAAVSGLFSIAVSHILLGLAFVALLASGVKLRIPPIWLPLSLFIAGTILSLLLSPDPAFGRPQIRKFYIFLMLPCAYSLIRDPAHIRKLLLTMAGATTLSALRSLVQFYDKQDRARQLGVNFYESYIADRITGFMSHWMTFSSQVMFALLLVSAFLFFAPVTRRRLWLWLPAGAVLSAALVLGLTRGVWLGTAVAGIYLVWFWRPKLLLIAPAVLAVGFVVSPDFLKARVMSAMQPRGEVDSNQHRSVTLRTGLRMVKAHPWFGLGPEHINRSFKEYLPEDVKSLPSGWYGHLHNIYLHYAAERGIPTMLALMWMIGLVLRDLFRGLKIARASSDERFILQAAIAIVIATLVVGFFELNLGDSEVLMLFITVVSFGYAARDALIKPEPSVV